MLEAMIHGIYEHLLKRQITELPGQICFMISGEDMAEAPDTLFRVTSWCREINGRVNHATPSSCGIHGITFHISTKAPDEIRQYLPAIRKISSIARLKLHIGDDEEISGTGMDVVVAIGKSGREEITRCIRTMAEKGVGSANVDEKTLESSLTFKYSPDVVVKSGGDHLTDFLIWQSVYSELFFSDVNWGLLRKVDLLRVLRDYQARIRRFGK